MKVTRAEVVAAGYAHVASLLFNAPLALTRERAQQLATYLAARMRGHKPEAVVDLEDLSSDPIALTHAAGGVAVLTVQGTLVPKGSNMDALSGLVGYDRFAKQLGALAETKDVRGVVLALNSPGGSVLGVSDAAAAVKELAATKPVFVVADHLTASAAYWLASQATKVFVSETSLVGAIGSVMVRHDATGADEKAGDAFTFVSEMARKGDGDPHKPISSDEEASMRAIIRHADGLFFAAVSEGRGISVSAIKKFDGEIFMGRAAIAAGLADEVGTVADAVAALTATLTPQRRSAAVAAQGEGSSMSTESQGGAPSAEVHDITKHPDFAKAAAALADRQTAEALERDREIRGLCALFGLDATKTEAFVASDKSRADIYAELQAARVAADQATDVRGTHGGSGPGRKPEHDTREAVAAEYAARAQAHREAYAAQWGGRA